MERHQQGGRNPGSRMSNGGKSLIIRADASERIGAGHIMRCLALSKAWQDSGGRVTFASTAMMPALEQRLQNEGCEVVRLGTDVSSEQDMERSAALAEERVADWVVVDGYGFGPPYHKALRQRNVRLLTMDDNGSLGEYCADVILNPGAWATEAIYAQREPHTRLLLGSQFVLLRPEFTCMEQKRDCSTSARKLLVTMGASDPENVTLKVLSAVVEVVDEGTEIRVVAGSGYRHLDELRTFAASVRQRVGVESNPVNMAPLMAWADMAISAAGGTCWELAFMGTPSVLISISQDQLENGKAAAERGIACNLGWHADLSTQKIADAVQMLLHDGERRFAMCRAGQELVDGLGPKRVVNFLQSAR